MNNVHVAGTLRCRCTSASVPFANANVAFFAVITSKEATSFTRVAFPANYNAHHLHQCTMSSALKRRVHVAINEHLHGEWRASNSGCFVEQLFIVHLFACHLLGQVIVCVLLEMLSQSFCNT